MNDSVLNAANEPIDFAPPSRAIAYEPQLDELITAPAGTIGGGLLLVLFVLLMPLLGLAVAIALPLAGFGAVVSLAGKGVTRRLATLRGRRV